MQNYIKKTLLYSMVKVGCLFNVCQLAAAARPGPLILSFRFQEGSIVETELESRYIALFICTGGGVVEDLGNSSGGGALESHGKFQERGYFVLKIPGGRDSILLGNSRGEGIWLTMSSTGGCG